MGKIDPTKERERLAALYAAMNDLELAKVGSNPESLTDLAFETLQEEMKKRGLEWAGQNMPLPSQMVRSETVEDPGNRPVILRRYRDMPEAFVARSVLEDSGIECVLQDDNVVRMDWLWSNAMGGIKLVVREKDAQEAERILRESPGDTEESGSTSKEAS